MIEKIPREMQEKKQWLVWKPKKAPNGGRPSKVPYDIKTGRKAKTNDPKTWSAFEEAVAAYEKSNIYAGIGFVFAPGGGFVGIDLDECLTDGEPSEEARRVLRKVNSYTEKSPSGSGLHIIVKGEIPGGRSRLITLCKRGIKRIEIYSFGQFLTMTGETVKGYEELREAGKGFYGLCRKIEAVNEQPAAARPEEESAARFDDSIFLLHTILPALPCEKVSYHEWIKIGMACKLAGLSCEDWEEWSATDAARYREGECAAKWRGFSDTDAGRKVDVGTAVNIAKKYGWKPETGSAGTQRKKGAALPSASMPDLMGKDLPPIKWAVVDMIPQGLTLLAAPPKYGKSWFVLDLCYSVSTGRPFMGHETVKGGAIYLALEDSENRLQERMKKLAAGDPVPASFRYSIDAETLDSGLIGQLEDHLQKNPDCALIVIDTLQKVSGDRKSTESVYGYDYRRMAALKNFADNHGVSLVVVHHLRKGKPDGDPFDRISGTSGLLGAVDTMITMQRKNREDAETEFHLTGRNVSENDLVIEFDKTSFRWNLKGELGTIKYESDPIVQTVRHLLEESDEWKGTATELWEACEMFTGKPIDEDIGQFGKHIRAAAREMCKRERVLYSPPGKNGGKAGRQHLFRKDTEEETIF